MSAPENAEGKDRRMMRTGIVGAALAAVCCFTPLLVVLAGGLGLSAALGYVDYMLFPMLFAFLGVTAQALYLRFGRVGPSPKPIIVVVVIALSALIIWLEFRYAIRLTIAAVAAVALYGAYLRAASRRASPAE